ncbi:MAG: zinc-binding dehydrogenase, partial [Acidimicrobiia bacterium]
TGKLELVRSIGADHVIDYTQEDFADGSRQYDLIIDIGGRRRLKVLRRALTPKGTLVLLGGEDGGKFSGGMNRQLRALVLSMFVGQRLTMFVAKQNRTYLEDLTQFIDAGEVSPFIDKTYSLADVPEAMRQLEAGKVRGKIAITI